MTFALAVHSSKGGTGKTSIAVNLAAAYAMDGKNVCLLDVDIISTIIECLENEIRKKN